MAVLAVLNRKGGVGKTTTAITLAHGLAIRLRSEKGDGNVLIVDLDPQGHVAAALGLGRREPDLADVLVGNADAVDAVIPAGRPGLYVLPSSDRLAGAKRALRDLEAVALRAGTTGGVQVPFVETRTVLRNRLGRVAEAFNYVILDCPPSLDDLAEAVYDFAEEAVVPVKTDYLGATGTRQHTADIVAARERGHGIRITHLVPTFYRSREVLAREVLADLATVYGRKLISSPVPQAVALEQAPADHHKTIFEFAPEHPAARAYAGLVNRVYRRQ